MYFHFSDTTSLLFFKCQNLVHVKEHPPPKNPLQCFVYCGNSGPGRHDFSSPSEPSKLAMLTL